MRAFWSFWVGVVALLFSSVALAQDAGVDELAQQLQQAKDFRVRTQAALSLGSSKSKRAVVPLCRGLQDESSTVRAAAAAALGKLKKGGLECLRKQLSAETKASVKTVISRSIASIEGAAGPVLTDQTKYYVVFEVVDDTGRADDGLVEVFHAAVAAAAKSLPEFSIAPRGQTLDQGKSLLAKHPAVTGFLLSAKVKTLYESGALTVRIEVAIFTYPDRNLLGTFSRTLTMQGVSTADRAAEDELVRTGAARSLDTFAPMASKLR